MTDPDRLKPVIFTDLDGTLLDHDSYSWQAARPALQRIRQLGIPCLFNSSKTLSEMLDLAREMDIAAPLICENGGGVAVPLNWSPCEPGSSDYRRESYRLHTLGASGQQILQQLEPLRARYRFRSYSQMTVEEVAGYTGLSLTEAAKSMQREFTEPCVWMDTRQAFKAFCDELAQCNLLVQRGGRFAHVMGKSDKGCALKWCMKSWFGSGRWHSIAAGDGENDVAMLDVADVAIVVRSRHAAAPATTNANCRLTADFGPAGWSGAILAELDS